MAEHTLKHAYVQVPD